MIDLDRPQALCVPIRYRIKLRTLRNSYTESGLLAGAGSWLWLCVCVAQRGCTHDPGTTNYSTKFYCSLQSDDRVYFKCMMSTSRRAKSKREDNDNSDAETPEVVSSTSDEIKLLRELHEQSAVPTAKKRRRKKDNTSPAQVFAESIELSVLEAAASEESGAVGNVPLQEKGQRLSESYIPSPLMSSKRV